jgi:hypothetical protein
MQLFQIRMISVATTFQIPESDGSFLTPLNGTRLPFSYKNNLEFAATSNDIIFIQHFYYNLASSKFCLEHRKTAWCPHNDNSLKIARRQTIYK